MDINEIRTLWRSELNRIDTELELLSPPRAPENLSIKEISAYFRQHREERKEEYDRIFRELQVVLQEIADVYASADETLRIRMRGFLKKFQNISSSMESVPYLVREYLKSAQDADIFRFGLIVASMQDQAIDCRDWSLSVSALIGEAKSVGIDVNPIVQEVADISDPEEHKHAFWTTRNAFLRFVH
jgi:hypothetical protein